MKRSFIFMVLVSLMIVIVACGGDEEATPTLSPTPTSMPVAVETAPEPEEIVVSMGDLFFGDSNDNLQNPPIWTVTSGAEVTVAAENRSGALQHN